MPVGRGIAQLHQRGFLVPGEPHCQQRHQELQEESSAQLDIAAMETTAILLLLWLY